MKNKWFWIIGGTIVLAGAIGSYLLLRKPKSNEGKNDFEPPCGNNPFSTKDELISFQRWVINTKGDKTILGKGGSTGLGDDGVWGCKTNDAYKKYGKDYK